MAYAAITTEKHAKYVGEEDRDKIACRGSNPNALSKLGEGALMKKDRSHMHGDR